MPTLTHRSVLESSPRHLLTPRQAMLESAAVSNAAALSA